MNEEIESLTNILKELAKLPITGIFFYDLAILEIKKELKLNIDLVWNQTHMVNNYRTCDYYYNKGVKYALLGKEITIDEIKDIINKSSIISMVEVVSRPSVAFSKRKLLTNYFQDIKENKKNKLTVKEKVTGDDYLFYETKDGTSIFLNNITNGTSFIKDLADNNCQYIIMREFGLEEYFKELVIDTMNYINNNYSDNNYLDKYQKIGNSTNFFQKKTIYQVKKS